MVKEVKVDIVVDDKRKIKKVSRVIENALELLPDKVGLFFSKNPIVFSVETIKRKGVTNAHTFSFQAFKNKKVFVHLYAHIWDYPEESIIEIIHHELAHSYLGHTKKITNDSKDDLRKEREVKRLLKKWETI